MRWDSIKIEDACERIIDYRGKTPKKSDAGLRLITAKVIKGGRINDEPAEYITEAEYDRWMTRGIPKKGDVLLTTEAPLGEVAMLRTDEKIALAQRSILLRTDEAKLYNKFLLYVLQTPLMQGRLNARATGTTVVGIKNKELRKVEIPLPPIDVQKFIASMLADIDDLIENNHRRIQLLETSARLLYKEWFVRLRFPGHEHVKITDGAPEGWAKKTIKDVLTLNYGKALKADNRVPGIFPVYGSSGNVGSHNKPLIKAPGIIIGRKGNVGSIYWINKDFWPIDTVYFINNKESNLYLYHALQGVSFINTDVAVPGLSRNMAYSREILIPAPNILSIFLEEVKPIQAQIEQLIKYNEKLTQARDILLPRLMNGELTV